MLEGVLSLRTCGQTVFVFCLTAQFVHDATVGYPGDHANHWTPHLGHIHCRGLLHSQRSFGGILVACLRNLLRS